MNKNNKGFTLVELLATIIVLGILIGITVYIAINVIGKSKEKSYQVTINEIEKNSGNYISERDDLTFIQVEDNNEDYEYQCVTIENLIDYGYLSNDVLDSKVNENETVSLGDYVYVERDKKTKAITKSIYTRENDVYFNKCGAIMLGNGVIKFTSVPRFEKWSKYKDVTIIYNVNNLNDLRELNRYSFEFEYNGTYTYDEANDTLNKSIKTKQIRVTSNGKLTADIILDNSPACDQAVVNIDRIDTVGPVITSNYTGSNKVRHSVTIPLKIVDRNVSGSEASGVDEKTVKSGNIEVKIGNQIITDHKLTHVGGNDYNLVINNDMYDGTITLNIPKDKVFDIAGNGNDDTPIDTGITFDNTYKITYHGNGGTSSKWGETWVDTVRYGEEYSTPANWYTRKGYNFNGWNEAANGSGVAWSLNSNGVFEAIRDNGKSKWKWTYLNDIDLYAQWNAKTYTINYNCGTGSGTAPASQTVKYDANVTIPSNAGSCSKTGHVLSNLTSPGKNGSGTSNWKGWTGKWQYDNGEYGISNNKLTLTAAWAAKSITVTFNCNGGSGGGNKTYTYGTSGQKFPNPALCSKSGYIGTEWTRPDDKTHTWTSGVSDNWINNVYDNKYKNTNHNITLKAVWVKNESSSSSNSGSYAYYKVTGDDGKQHYFGNSKDAGEYAATQKKTDEIRFGNENGESKYADVTHNKNGSTTVTTTSGNVSTYTTKSSTTKNNTTVPKPSGGGGTTKAAGGGKGNCFLAGTKVATINGYKDIDRLSIGDLVLTYNEGTGNNEYHRVVNMLSILPEDNIDDLYTLTFDDNSEIQASASHRFYINRDNKYMWIQISKVVPGDLVMYSDKTMHKVIGVEYEDLTDVVYNIMVEEAHNFYVGDNQVLVHNTIIKKTKSFKPAVVTLK